MTCSKSWSSAAGQLLDPINITGNCSFKTACSRLGSCMPQGAQSLREAPQEPWSQHMLLQIGTRPPCMLLQPSHPCIQGWRPRCARCAGVPFRETHHISGAAVKLAEDRDMTLFDLTVEDLKGIHPQFEDDVLAVPPCPSTLLQCRMLLCRRDGRQTQEDRQHLTLTALYKFLSKVR